VRSVCWRSRTAQAVGSQGADGLLTSRALPRPIVRQAQDAIPHGVDAHGPSRGWFYESPVGPMLRAYSTFEASRVEKFSGIVRGQLEVARSLKRPPGLVKSFFSASSAAGLMSRLRNTRAKMNSRASVLSQRLANMIQGPRGAPETPRPRPSRRRPGGPRFVGPTRCKAGRFRVPTRREGCRRQASAGQPLDRGYVWASDSPH
jgi:hypothetical protein